MCRTNIEHIQSKVKSVKLDIEPRFTREQEYEVHEYLFTYSSEIVLKMVATYNQLDVQTNHLCLIICLLTICAFVPANNKLRCYHSCFCSKYDCDNMLAYRSGILCKVKHKMYSFHTVLTSITSKQTK